MKTRILTAAVLVPALFIVTLVLPKMVAAVIFALLMAIAAYELLYCTGLVKHSRLVLYSSVMAFAMTMWSYSDAIHAWLVLLILAFTFLLFMEMMLDHVKVRLEKLCLCMFAGIVVPFLLGALIRILVLYVGRYVIMIPFVVAFLNDAGAYFVGIKYGRHKLAPVVSPNKSIEGALGGIATAMAGMLVYALILDVIAPQFTVNYGLALLYGFAGSLVGIFGDLCFSVIKRQTGIKDYGNLFPGHGGVLDRFDSLMAVAPLMEAMLLLLPMVM